MPSNASHWDKGVDYAARSDIGLRRTNNQDSFVVASAGSQEHWQRRGHLFVVADGMGAHAAGEYASKLAVDNVPHTYHKLVDEPPLGALGKAIEEANRVIHTRGQANLEFQGMGTTCTALVLLPEGAAVAHVGDSRAYRLRGNRLEQLTFDHSLVWELMASGQLGKQDVPGHFPKNIITRSLGPNPDVQVDLEGPFPLAVGDVFLLCSDGLSGQVANEELAMVLAALEPQEAVRSLVDLANLRGGPDNITVIVVRVTGAHLTRYGSAAPEAGQPAEPSGRRASPLWWVASLVLLLAAMAIWAAGYLALAGGVLILAALAALAWLLATPRLAQPSGRSAALGRAPYATAIASPGPDFVAELTRIYAQLQEAAEQEQWAVDWEPVEAAAERAGEAAGRKDYSAAVRAYCRAISLLMSELRHQRRPKSDNPNGESAANRPPTPGNGPRTTDK